MILFSYKLFSINKCIKYLLQQKIYYYLPILSLFCHTNKTRNNNFLVSALPNIKHSSLCITGKFSVYDTQGLNNFCTPNKNVSY